MHISICGNAILDFVNLVIATSSKFLFICKTIFELNNSVKVWTRRCRIKCHGDTSYDNTDLLFELSILNSVNKSTQEVN